jgi:hypothetical protein
MHHTAVSGQIGLIACDTLYTDLNILEKHAASIFRVEMVIIYLQNVDTCVSNYTE